MATFPRAPTQVVSRWSVTPLNAQSLTSLIRNGLQTTFTLSATSSVSPVQPQKRLGPPSEPMFRFRFGSPQKRGFGFGFKTDPGLIPHTSLYKSGTSRTGHTGRTGRCMNHAPAILAAPALIYSTHRLLAVWIIVAHFHLCSLLDRYTALEVSVVRRPMRVCCGSGTV